MQGLGNDVTNYDLEPVSAQVPHAQLVGVQPGLEDAHARQFLELGQPVRVARGQAYPLPGYRVLVLEAGHADGLFGDAQLLAKMVEDLPRRQAAFFEKNVEVLALAGGPVSGHLGDGEVFGLGADAPAGAGKRLGEVGVSVEVEDEPARVHGPSLHGR